jgi:DNA (cytosine-5)-methyltransferase 1
MTHGSLFSGIGGFDLAAEWMGWENIFHCEWNPFGQKVLKYHFPNSISYEDITKTNFTIHRERIDILTGGFPCQPYSMAGKRLGKEDERHLWPEMLRAIREIQPRWVVGENVLGLVNWSGGLVFHEVQADLEAEGYEVQPYVLPAVSVNAPHRRDRVWFVAKNTNENGWRGEQRKKKSSIGEFGNIGARDNERIQANDAKIGNATNPNSNGLNQRNGNDEKQPGQGGFDALNDINEVTMHTNGTSKQGEHIGQTREGKFNGPDSGDGFDNFQNFPTQSPICTRDDGLSSQLDGITFSKWRNESIKAGGNAIVPQVVYQIFKAIEEYETQAIPR